MLITFFILGRSYFLFNDINLGFQFLIFWKLFRDLIDTMNNRRMILFTEYFSDVDKRGSRHGTDQIHNDLPWKYKFGISLFGYDILRGNSIVLGHNIDNKLWCDFLGLVRIDDVL